MNKCWRCKMLSFKHNRLGDLCDMFPHRQKQKRKVAYWLPKPHSETWQLLNPFNDIICSCWFCSISHWDVTAPLMFSTRWTRWTNRKHFLLLLLLFVIGGQFVCQRRKRSRGRKTKPALTQQFTRAKWGCGSEGEREIKNSHTQTRWWGVNTKLWEPVG